MKLIKHPNVIRMIEVWSESLYVTYVQSHICILKDFIIFLQVMASKTKIYFVLELVTGGELFDKIVSFFVLLNIFFFF